MQKKQRQKRNAGEVNASPLKELMKEHYRTFKWLEDQTGYSRVQLSKIMNGKQLVSKELFHELSTIIKGESINKLEKNDIPQLPLMTYSITKHQEMKVIHENIVNIAANIKDEETKQLLINQLDEIFKRDIKNS